ncbi:MAG: hypothetical protein AB1782_12610 [Cyanobacteriota bacterium]
MKNFFKKFARTIANGLVDTAKEELKTNILNELKPSIVEESYVKSDHIVIQQLDSLLNTFKIQLMDLKIKSSLTLNNQDDIFYQKGLLLLKEFSQSVNNAIREIENY